MPPKTVLATIGLFLGLACLAQETPAPGSLSDEEEELYGGEVPIPSPFDPFRMLDDEALDAYLIERVTNDPDSLLMSAPAEGVDIPISMHGSNTNSDDGTVVVGWVSCPDIRAHNPHKGAFSGTVKAKASGYCVFRPSGQGVPPPPTTMWWTLRMSLISYDRGVMAIGRFKKRGWGPRWKANVPRLRGTQVDSRRCYNGTYLNLVVVLLEVPPLYSAPSLMAVRLKSDRVDNC